MTEMPIDLEAEADDRAERPDQMTEPTTLSRRTVLQVTGAGALVLTLPTAPSWAAAPAPARRAAAHLRRSSYVGLEGARFGAGSVTLTLAEVTDLAAAATEPGLRDHDEAFVATFTGPASDPLPSGMHAIEHPELGTSALFLTPSGQPRRGVIHYDLMIDRTVRIPAALDALEPELAEPAPTTAPSGSPAAAVTPAATAAPVWSPKPDKPSKRIRVKPSARRAGKKVRLELRFPGGGVQSVQVRLRRKGKTHARGEALVRKGRVVMRLDRTRRVARRRYDLVITVTTRSGGVVTITRTVRVR